MKAIAYALFGYGAKKEANSFPFDSYLRGLAINIMLNRLLYPGWHNVVVMDKESHEYCGHLVRALGAEVEVLPRDQFCKMMLWRFRPAFYTRESGKPKYSHVLCRDTDSPPTYRERQAVEQWLMEEATAHAITDSVSHGIPMLGGMIGVRSDYFKMRMQVNTWEELIALNGMALNRKGTDQDFINQVIYPVVSKYGHDTITQHYFKGMPNTNLSRYHRCLCDSVAGHQADCPLNVRVPGVSTELAELNSVAGHIGAAGFYEPPMMGILEKYKEKFTDLLEVQREHPQLFYWAK